MTDLVETLARALCVVAGHDPHGPTCDIYVPDDPHAGIPWAGYRRDARAIVAALESAGYRVVPVEMTEAMIAAAWAPRYDPDQAPTTATKASWSSVLAAAPKVTE